MRRICCLVSLLMTLFTMVSSRTPAANGALECHKSYRITGVGADGQAKAVTMRLRRPQAEPTGFDPVTAEQGDMRFYSPYYVVVGVPTYKQNCAGLVMERHFGIRNTYFPAQQIFNELIQNFARPISGPYQAGDIVVFGSASHVAFVTGPGSSNSRAMIVSKDNQEAIVQGELNMGSPLLQNDPIKKKNGGSGYLPSIWEYGGSRSFLR